MKLRLSFYSVLLLALLAAGCEKDNFEPPQSKVSGRVVYNGEPVGIRSTGVAFEIWQRGYQLFTKIPLNISQDGTFSALLFDGDYKIVRSAGAGPWTDLTDSINVNVDGGATLDIPVTPYYWIKDVSFVKNGSNVEATFSVVGVNTTKTLEAIRLYLGPNFILDQQNNSANIQVATAAVSLTTPMKLTLAIPAALANDNFIYARVGVKTTGIAELLYSGSQKIQVK